MPYIHPLFSPPLRGSRALSAVLDDTVALWNDLEASARSHWIDLTTRTETDTTYAFVIELPGFKREHLTVEVLEIADATYLRVRAAKDGARGVWTQSNDGVVDSANCRERTITLPTDADPTKVEAKLEDGLLTLTVAKVIKVIAAQPRKVAVS